MFSTNASRYDESDQDRDPSKSFEPKVRRRLRLTHFMYEDPLPMQKFVTKKGDYDGHDREYDDPYAGKTGLSIKVSMH